MKKKKIKVVPIIALIQEIRQLILSARNHIVKNVNITQVLTNFEIGRQIVEYEQKGFKRAAYGEQILKELAGRLSDEFGLGFSERNLRNIRKFYLIYQKRSDQIRQMASAKSTGVSKDQIVFEKLPINMPSRKLQTRLEAFFQLSWSQYVFLIGIKDENMRNFYEIEAVNNNWTLPELARQFNSGLYERLALSRDKRGVRKLSKEGLVVSKPEDLLK